jgi:uncharacterized protein (DUF433 family)
MKGLTMISTPVVIDVPLRTDQDGVIRIGPTRVTLVTIIQCLRRGDTAEYIHEGFPTVPFADIHSVIAYYLLNQREVDEYVDEILAEGERLRQLHEANDPKAQAFNEKMRKAKANYRPT